MKTKVWGLLAVSIFGIFLSACDRVSSGRTSLVIQMPTASEMQKMSKSDVSALAAVDLQKLCFAVNLKGPSITKTPAKTCNMERGIFTDSVKPGQTLELKEIEAGPDHTIELYAFVRTKDTDVCPQTPKDGSWNWPLDKTFFLGRTAGINLVPPETKVEIQYSLPVLGQNIVTQNSWPATCIANLKSGGKRLGRIVSGASVLQTASNFKVYSKVSPLSDQKTLGNPTGYKVLNWKVGQ